MKAARIEFTKDEIEINHKIYMERIARYKKHGINHEELKKL